MNKTELIEVLNSLNKKTNAEWLTGLEERKIKELDFHNRDRDEQFQGSISQDTYQKIYGNRAFYKTVEASTQYIKNWIAGNAPGKVFLDYACGNGDNARLAASHGADISIGIDISNISIENARRITNQQEFGKNIFFVQCDAENTGLPDNCIDLIICSGVLHHLDLSYAFFEMRRILKPGGRIFAIEALDYNPFIRLYRMMTPDMRTEWEKDHILSYADLKFAGRFFTVKNIKHWHLASIAGRYIPKFLPLLNSLDKVLLKVPVIKRMSWMFTFELVKEND